MASEEFDMRAHRETYAGVMRLTQYVVACLLFIVLGMMVGLIWHMPLIGFGGMIVGLIAATIWFATGK